MKRIIAVLALIALLVSFTGVPVSAAAINPPAFAGRGDSDPLRAVQMAVPEGAKPMAAATLDEALNVPGGTLEFSTFSMPSYGFYDWVVEEDYAKSNSAGHDGGPENPYGPYTQSQVSTWVDFGEDQAISFRFRVSCQDAEETDYFALFVDQVPAGVWYGEVDCQPAVRCGGPPNQGGEFMSLHCNRRTQLLLLTGLILLVLLVAFLAGRLIPDSAVAADFAQAKEPPSWSHPFGTDHLGRDLFLRTLKGLSTSLTVGICASAISAVAAVLIGIAAATGSRAMDSFINWLIDLVMGVPHTVLVILISFACGRGLKGLLIGVAATHWTGLARLIRGEVLQLRSQQYVAVSRRLGKSSGWILLHHLLPHLVPQFLVGLILMLPHAILHEASISFLGYGLPPEQPAIGIILAESMKYLSAGMWWSAVFPGLLLVAMVLLTDRLGENLRVILDPYSAQE